MNYTKIIDTATLINRPPKHKNHLSQKYRYPQAEKLLFTFFYWHWLFWAYQSLPKGIFESPFYPLWLESAVRSYFPRRTLISIYSCWCHWIILVLQVFYCLVLKIAVFRGIKFSFWVVGVVENLLENLFHSHWVFFIIFIVSRHQNSQTAI